METAAVCERKGIEPPTDYVQYELHASALDESKTTIREGEMLLL